MLVFLDIGLYRRMFIFLEDELFRELGRDVYNLL